MYVDNQSSIAISNNPRIHRHTKNYNVDFHKTCNKVSMTKCNIVHIIKTKMATDDYIKNLFEFGFLEFCQVINVNKGS